MVRRRRLHHRPGRSPRRAADAARRPDRCPGPQGRHPPADRRAHAGRPARRPAAGRQRALVQADARLLRPARRRPEAARGQRRQGLPAAGRHPRLDALARRRLAGLPVAVRHRRRVHRLRRGGRRPVRTDQGAPAGAARRVRDRQRGQRQDRARGDPRRRGLLRRERRRRQHRRVLEVPLRGGAGVALDRRRRLPARPLPGQRQGDEARRLARRRRRRLARGARQRRARGHGRGEARQRRLHDPGVRRPGRPGPGPR